MGSPLFCVELISQKDKKSKKFKHGCDYLVLSASLLNRAGGQKEAKI